jgi:hypothetical protein
MSASIFKRAAVAGAALTLAGPVTVAQAHHDNGRTLCNQKFAGTYQHAGRIPIQTGNIIGGHISVNVRQTGSFLRVCVVTIRRNHAGPRFTGIRIKQTGDNGFRSDASPDYTRYAGPVMRGFDASKPGECVYGRGRIGDWTSQFRFCSGVVET